MLILKSIALFGLGLWLLIAALNNFLDPNTNRHLLAEMFSMELLKKERLPLGKGLLSRAWNNKFFIKYILIIIAVLQILIACFLIFTATMVLYTSVFKTESVEISINIANYALSFFVFFGLYFYAEAFGLDTGLSFIEHNLPT